MMPLAFGSPAALLVILACVPIVWLARHTYRRLSGVRRALTTGVRVGGLLLLALALSGFRLQRPTDALATIFLVDESASVSAAGRRHARDVLQQAVTAARPEDRYAVVAFGREPIVASGWTVDPEDVNYRVHPDATATNLSDALDVALALLPDHRTGRVVLLSDGRETHGEAGALAGPVRWRHASVDVVPLESGGGVDAAVMDVDVPEVVEPGGEFAVRVELRSETTKTVALRLYRNGKLWRDDSMRLSPGSSAHVYRDEAPAEGTLLYRAVLEAPSDSRPENNEGLAFLRVSAPPKVWIVDGDGAGAALGATLAQRGIPAARVGAVGLPDTPAGYADVQAVVLNNVSSDLLTHGQQDALAAAVREFGVGLLMVGSERSFGPGGWRDTPVEGVLPVRMESTRPREGTVGIVLVIDVSGSMSKSVEGQPRLRYAQEAALSAFQVAEPDTLVGVVAFSDVVSEPVLLQPKPDSLDDVLTALRRLRADGGTMASRALRAAVEMLTASDATTRHIILLTDGAFQDAPAVRDLYPALQTARISVSTIGAGPSVDEDQLRELADACNGNFYPYRRAAALPALFARDALQVVRKPVIEGPILPIPRAGGVVVAGVNWADAPTLDAMISVTLKDDAQLHVSSPDQDPLIASWRVGLARTAVLTTDLGPRFAASWQDWSQRDRLWESLVRGVLPPPNPAIFAADMRLEGDDAILTADAVDATGAFVDNLQLEATVQPPEGPAQTVRLRQVGPGQYAGRVRALGLGLFTGQVRDVSAAAGGRQWVTAARPYPVEYIPGPAGTEVMLSLAQETGGRVLESPRDAFRPPPAPRPVQTELWPWLTAAALCLFPLDVGLRRFTGGWRRGSSATTLAAAGTRAARGRAGGRRDRARVRRGAVPQAAAPVRPQAPAEPRATAPAAAPAEEPQPRQAQSPAMQRILDAKRRAREEADDA